MVLSVRLQQSFLLSGSDGSVLSINVGTPSKNPECSNTADCCAHPYNISRSRASKSCLTAELCFNRFVHFSCVSIYIFGFTTISELAIRKTSLL